MLRAGTIQLADGLTAGAILVALIATALAAKKAWEKESFRRLIPGAVVTVIGLLVLIAFYRWGFSEGPCDGRGDVVCLTNANQGVLTLIALLIAAIAVWVEVLSRYGEEQKQAQKRKERADKMVAAAITECRHNLVHIALCYDNGQMTRVPWGISIEAISVLGRPEIRPDVDDRLLGRLDALYRTYQTLQECRARVDNARSDEECKEAMDYLLGEPEPFKAFVMQHMGFLLHAWSGYSGISICQKILKRSGLQDLPRIARATNDAGGRRFDCFRTSEKEAQEEAATIRTRESPVMCWIDDGPIGVRTFAFEPRFNDAANSHRH